MFFNREKKFDTDKEVPFNDLIEACIKANSSAVKRLITDYYSYAMKVCIIYSKTHEDAEEHVNDGFLKVMKNLHTYDINRPFVAWMRTIMINTCIDKYKSKMHQMRIIPIEELSNTSTDETILASLAADEILALIKGLPTYCKTVFLLYAVEGFNHKEIANQLNITEGTSKSHLRDARIKLQLILKDKMQYTTPSQSKNYH